MGHTADHVHTSSVTADSRRTLLRTVGLALVSIALIALVRADLFAKDADATIKTDTTFLPPPEQVVVMSLGYRHAFADVLWAHILVSQGMRIRERRRFDILLELYDAVNALDPTFRTPYLMADALITFNVIPTTRESHVETVLPYKDVVKAREVMERGVEALPNDAELWLTLGQFVSFVAPPSYLEDKPEVAARWRREGVAYLQRAVELSGGDSSYSWQALGGARILKDAGELDAMVRFYERAYAVTEDEELRKDIERRLTGLRKQRELELGKLDAKLAKRVDAELEKSQAYQRRRDAAETLMETELPFLTMTAAYLLGPPLQPAKCAGPNARGPQCTTTWRDWAAQFEATAPTE